MLLRSKEELRGKAAGCCGRSEFANDSLNNAVGYKQYMCSKVVACMNILVVWENPLNGETPSKLARPSISSKPLASLGVQESSEVNASYGKEIITI